MRVGQAAGAHFLRGDHRHRVVIGKDTRLSGYMMEIAMISGFTSVGMDVVLVGPVPTPGGRDADPFDARRSRRDDLRQPQPLSPTTASNCSAPTATSSPTRTSWRSRRCSRRSRSWSHGRLIGRARADRGRARPLHPCRQVDLPRASPARRAQGGRRLRQRRRLSGRALGACGSSAPR